MDEVICFTLLIGRVKTFTTCHARHKCEHVLFLVAQLQVFHAHLLFSRYFKSPNLLQHSSSNLRCSFPHYRFLSLIVLYWHHQLNHFSRFPSSYRLLPNPCASSVGAEYPKRTREFLSHLHAIHQPEYESCVSVPVRN